VIRVVVADDQRLIREGLRALIAGEPDLAVVGEAADGAAAVELCARTPVDVVLMDLRMPVLDGIAATRRLRARDDGPSVVVLTTFDTDELVLAALRAGASGFLLKDAPAETLFDGIRAVASGEATLAPTVTRRLLAYVAAVAPSPAQPAPTLAGLTPREREVLVAIAQGRSNADIAADLVVSEATVKTHVSRIFEKLAVRDRAQAVVAAYESGLVHPRAST
jgi:DNA-binding NarL/FixJ family response regulator